MITILVLGLILTQSKTFLLGRAANQQYNLPNSYVFASPLTAKSVSEKIRVTVFLLDDKGRGVLGKKIDLASVSGLNVSGIQSVTDSLGQAVFDVTSGAVGQYVIAAQVEGNPFPQTVTVRFE